SLNSASLKTGYETIRTTLINKELDLYQELKTLKLSKSSDEIIESVEKIKEHLNIPEIKETFYMKLIAYTIINKFWDGICFLNRQKVKNNMYDEYNSEFTLPLLEHIEIDQKTQKNKCKKTCIECGEIYKKECKLSMMCDTMDDLGRKKSAFWNFNVDAFICPKCAFAYALVPIGFNKYSSDFIFINSNDSIINLLNLNKREKGKIDVDTKSKMYYQVYTKLMNNIVKEKKIIMHNVQVVSRKTVTTPRGEKQIYNFNIIGKNIVNILSIAEKSLTNLSEKKMVNINGEYVNIYLSVLQNILEYKNQYQLINKLLRYSIQDDYLKNNVSTIMDVQIAMRQESKGGYEMNKNELYYVGKSANELRNELLNSTNKDVESLRGVIYQLLNALKVGDKYKFTDLILRLYSSCKKQIPANFMSIFVDDEDFLDLGYTFVLGLKGGIYNKKKEEEENLNE
ncbi:MAG: Cas8a1 family CRISPR/Cas system-associated protein, partial [Clostridia bacterium]